MNYHTTKAVGLSPKNISSIKEKQFKKCYNTIAMTNTEYIFNAYETQEVAQILQSNDPFHVNTAPITYNFQTTPITIEDLKDSYYININSVDSIHLFINNIATIYLAAYVKDILEDKTYIISAKTPEEIDLLNKYQSTLLYDLSIPASLCVPLNTHHPAKDLTDALHQCLDTGILKHSYFTFDTPITLLYSEQQNETDATAIVLQRWLSSFSPALSYIQEKINNLSKYWMYNKDFTPILYAYKYQTYLYAIGFEEDIVTTTKHIKSYQFPQISKNNIWLLHEDTFNYHKKALQLEQKRQDYLELIHILADHIRSLENHTKQAKQVMELASINAPTYLSQLQQTFLKSYPNIKTYAGLKSIMHEIGMNNIIQAYNNGVPVQDIF